MKDNVVVIGVTPTTSLIFDEEFPELQKVNIEAYDIHYSKSIPLVLKLLIDAPRIWAAIKKEHFQLEQIVKTYHIDVVISDNRFGLYSNQTDNIYITHQLNIQAGIFSSFANKIHHYFIKQFHTVWVPDLQDEKTSLAGKLTHHHSIKNHRYIGPLSRLPKTVFGSAKYDYLCLLSGPEPLRSELEIALITKANQSNKTVCIVRGTHHVLQSFINKNVEVFDAPHADDLASMIVNSKTVICRSGYSTLMDLHHLQKTNCILIPTPGQDEQEYLAEYWSLKTGFSMMKERDLKHFKFS